MDHTSAEPPAPDWLGACRRATQGVRAVLRDHPTSRERVVETGVRGEGGDRTLVIDDLAEQLVFDELDALHAHGHRFTAVSEERGEVSYGDPGVRVVIDPIDGSLNAKRGLPAHALSIAVADGPTMADVVFGFVHDLGTEEEWFARAGQGAHLDGVRIEAPPERRTVEGLLEVVAIESAHPRWIVEEWFARAGQGAHLDGVRIEAPPERRTVEGLLEVVAIESAHPRWIVEAGPSLLGLAHRVRALGSTALSLCQVAPARVDGMVTLWRCRSVDAAAGQLIVRESGGHVAFPGAPTPLGAPLDLLPHYPVVAARSPETLARLVGVPVDR